MAEAPIDKALRRAETPFDQGLKPGALLPDTTSPRNAQLNQHAAADSANTIQLIISAVSAVASLLLASIAIWPGWWRATFNPVKLTIKKDDVLDEPCAVHLPKGQQGRAYFFHLKVVNERRWNEAKNCRVLLKEVRKKKVNGDFVRLTLAVPLQFVWAPAESTGAQIAIQDEQKFDFGILIENEAIFRPRFYSETFSFNGRLAANEVMRYFLKVEADGFVSRRPQIFEVGWDGRWSDNPTEMHNIHLTIKEITEETDS